MLFALKNHWSFAPSLVSKVHGYQNESPVQSSLNQILDSVWLSDNVYFWQTTNLYQNCKKLHRLRGLPRKFKPNRCIKIFFRISNAQGSMSVRMARTITPNLPKPKKAQVMLPRGFLLAQPSIAPFALIVIIWWPWIRYSGAHLSDNENTRW